MEDSLIVFKEEKYYFGLFPQDFEQSFSLDQVWITPSPNSPTTWYFEKKSVPETGKFVHLGALFGFAPASFSYGGFIFLKKMPEIGVCGFFMDHFFQEITVKKHKKKLMDPKMIQKLPHNLNSAAFAYTLHQKHRRIFIIEPDLIINTYPDIIGS